MTIAVWDGKTLSFVEATRENTFQKAREAIDGYIQPVPKAFSIPGTPIEKLFKEHIAILCDEDGLNKRLKVTLPLVNHEEFLATKGLLGTVVFAGLLENEFVPLTEMQKGVIQNFLDETLGRKEEVL